MRSCGFSESQTGEATEVATPAKLPVKVLLADDHRLLLNGVRTALESSSHGRYLRSLGGEFLRDVERCAEIDALDRAFEV